jgi:hypothetical protein
MRKGRNSRNKPRPVDPDDEELPEDEAFAAGDEHLQAFVPQEVNFRFRFSRSRNSAVG